MAMTSVPQSKIGSFAILDLETSNLPMYNYNRTGIMELSIFGVAASTLKKPNGSLQNRDNIFLPQQPRVLHKLKLMTNPQMMVHPMSEELTGLNNDILEHESKFDVNAAHVLLGFLRHLQKPVCLVAHNGWCFDFPIIKQAFQKLDLELPNDIVCVDSLRAFLEIDGKHVDELQKTAVFVNEQPMVPVPSSTPFNDRIEDAASQPVLYSIDQVSEDTCLHNRQLYNETTPKRPTTATHASQSYSLSRKNRKVTLDDDKNDDEVTMEAASMLSKRPAYVLAEQPRVRRSLQFDATASPTVKKYPPRGLYRLEQMYRRIFQDSHTNAHNAEADVQMLLMLMLHYGEDFIDYSEQHAKPLANVPSLGFA